MTFEIRRRVFFHLPVGNAAGPADARKPFVPQPARRPAVSGISDYERFIAMGRDPRLIAHLLDRFDAMKQPPARRPELYFVDQPKKLDPFAIVTFGGFFFRFSFFQGIKSQGIDSA